MNFEWYCMMNSVGVFIICLLKLSDKYARWYLCLCSSVWCMLFFAQIHCRDCGHEGDTGYHVAGLKCTECGSYNTVRCGSEELPLVATDFLHRYQHQRQRGSSNGRPEWRRPRSRRSRHREGTIQDLIQWPLNLIGDCMFYLYSAVIYWYKGEFVTLWQQQQI